MTWFVVFLDRALKEMLDFYFRKQVFIAGNQISNISRNAFPAFFFIKFILTFVLNLYFQLAVFMKIKNGK